ncbi:MAG: helix-turn-helix transcriptional regulator, partial [Clostridia bacterium]|nr:helix-turn-helix transcriptional regulator [Clostridia bacterium]
RGYGEPVKSPPQDANAAVRTAIGYIRSHYEESLDLDRLASEVGLSKYHFIRKFKEATGQTVVSYINAVRIERAERLLREGQLSVAAVAEACGFPNHSYFSKVFCRLRGMLPSEVGTKP